MAKRKSKSRKALRAEIRGMLSAGVDPEGSPADLLQELFHRSRSAGRELGWLAAYDPDPELRNVCCGLLVVGLQAGQALPSMAERLREQVPDVLLGAIRDRALPDANKIELLPIYQAAGGTEDLDELGGYFDDFEAAMAKQLSTVFRSRSAEPRDVAATLHGLRLIDCEGEEGEGPDASERLRGAASLAASMAEDNPEAACAQICCAAALAAEHGEDHGAFREHLDAAAATDLPAAAWYLRELGGWPGTGLFGAQARALAGAMRERGVEAHHPWRAEFLHGLISAVDGAGSRGVTLFFRTPEGASDALFIVINDALGIRDVWCAFEEAEDAERRLREASREQTLVPCRLELARDVLGDALALHGRAGRPVPGKLLIYRPYLGAAPIPVAGRSPDLEAYALEEAAPDRAAAAESRELEHHAGFGGLALAAEFAYEFLRSKKRRNIPRVTDRLVTAFIRQVAEAGHHQLLLGQMAANLEVESLAGRAGGALNRLAARTWQLMRDGTVPLEKVTYVRLIAEDALEMARANLEMGFQSQAEANARALEMDLSGPSLPENVLEEMLADEDSPLAKLLAATAARREDRKPAKSSSGKRGRRKKARKAPRSGKSGKSGSKGRDSQPVCGLCGKSGKLTRTPCCGNWICDDEDQYQLFSYARNSCFRNHDRYTLCAFHYHEGHPGKWQDCKLCREAFDKTEIYVEHGTNEYNFEKLEDVPEYEPTRCSRCGRVIQLGEGGYSTRGDDYFCGRCTAESVRSEQ